MKKQTLLAFMNFLFIGAILILSIISIKYKSNYVSAEILLLEFISIFVCKAYQTNVERDQCDGKTIKEIIREIRPDKKYSSIQNARNELRLGLIIFASVSAAISLYWSIVSKNIWTFLLSIAAIWITYIYADYIPHAINYAKHYDYIYTKDIKNANAQCGLARIYKEEYHKSHSFKDKAFYQSLGGYSIDTDCDIQDKCIKSILFIKADSLVYPMTLYSVVILFFNIVLALPNIFEYSVNNVLSDFKFNIDSVKAITILTFNVVFALLNLAATIKLYKNCNIIQGIYRVFISGDNCERIKEYTKIREKDGKSFEIIRSRGVFTFCATYIDEGKKLDELDLKYRMLFTHRFYANKSRFFITFWFSLVILFCLIMTWETPMFVALISIVIYILAAVLLYFFWLPNLGKRRIVKFIKKL